MENGQRIAISEQSVRTDPYSITEMPSKEDLEDFLRRMAGGTSDVYFDTRTGTFRRNTPII